MQKSNKEMCEEKCTVCDSCKYLSQCDGTVEVTERFGKPRHFLPSPFAICKKEEKAICKYCKWFSYFADNIENGVCAIDNKNYIDYYIAIKCKRVKSSDSCKNFESRFEETAK